MSRLGALTNILNSRYEQNTDMAEYISLMESQFAQLAAIDPDIDALAESGSFTFIHQRPNLIGSSVNASIHTLLNDTTTWDHW